MPDPALQDLLQELQKQARPSCTGRPGKADPQSAPEPKLIADFSADKAFTERLIKRIIYRKKGEGLCPTPGTT